MKKWISYLLVFALVLSGCNFAMVSAEETAQDELLYFNAHSYQFVKCDNVTWSYANAICEKSGGHLVTVTTADEWKFLNELNEEYLTYWMGGFCEAEEKWQWVTGEDWSYTAWGEGQPDSASNCLAMEIFWWRSINGSDTENLNGFVCEWDYIDGVEPINMSDWTVGGNTEEPIKTSEVIETEPTPSGDSLPELACFDGHSYQVVIWSGLRWSEAKEICEAAGGHLATVTTEEEQLFLEALNADSVWIGGFREEIGEWQWVTGEAWEYTAWGEGEPNNSSNVVSNENCLAMWPYLWNDLNDDNTLEQYGFICEWDYVGKIEPIDMTGWESSGVEDNPVEPEKSEAPSEPVETVEPEKSEAPSEPVETVEPEKSEAPSEPAESVVPTEPVPSGTPASPVVTTPVVEPTPIPTDTAEENEDEEDEDDEELEKGDTFEKSGLVYTLLTARSVKVSGYTKESLTVTVGTTVTYKSVKYKITGIDSDAFSDMTSLKKIVIGDEVKSIGKRAFAGCKRLKEIQIKTIKLVSVGGNALKGIHSAAKILVPKKKYTAYKALLKKKGQKKTIKIVRQG